MWSKLDKRNFTRIKAIILGIIILLANFIQIILLTLGQVNIIDFRCDAELIGYRRYKADVSQKINFIYDAEDYENISVFLGDGTYLDEVHGSTFSHKYLMEGIYNITLWAHSHDMFTRDKEWLIIEVTNDPSDFDIGYTSVDYHLGTYDFEDEDLGEIPEDWTTYNNDFDFYLDNATNLNTGITIDGGVSDLEYEDFISWDIESQYTGYNFRYIDIFLHFKQWGDHILSPGQYKLYFSANESMSLMGYNPDLGEKEILFYGNYTYGQVITILHPQSLELIASYHIEYDPLNTEVIKIDWFKLERLYKGVEIIKDVFDHGRIVKLSFGEISQYCGIQQNFALQEYGTVEFWYRTENIEVGGRIFSVSNEFGIVQKDDKWFVGGNDLTHYDFGSVPLPLNNTWHHIRIDWAGKFVSDYMGLGYGHFRIYIDGKASIYFSMNPAMTGINIFNFETNSTVYIDAISYSWDIDYEIGDNLNSISPDHLYEDLEIRFSVVNLDESDIDKIGFNFELDGKVESDYMYIWDFGDGNYSYEESPYHKFTNAGIYPVRLTLIDDQGAMKTVLKEFFIENKKPESSILNGLNYDVTYDFKYDVPNEPPPELYTHGNIKVIDFRDEFSKVLEIDTKAGGYGMVRFPEPDLEYKGSIEFWIYFTDVANDQFYFWIDKLESIEDNPLSLKNSTRFGFFNGKWMYYYTYKGSTNDDRYAYREITELGLPEQNKWTHIRFDYSFSDKINYEGLTGNQWRVYVDGNASNIYQAVGKEFKRKGLDFMAGSHIFLDSIGFTSHPDYNLGDNNPDRLETYYGTSDFRFFPIGPIPYDETLQSTVLGPWIFGSYNFEKISDNSSARIIPNLDGHTKVLELYDNDEDNLVSASLLNFAEPKYGTIEFWLRTTDTSQGLVMALGHHVFYSGIWLGSDGKWWYKNGDSYYEILDVPQMENDTWHHIRIDFDCRNEGGYLGLDKNQFQFKVDGNLSQSGPFEFDYPVSDFGWNIWSTKEQGKNYSIFLDAIGTSWDPAYEIGDNKNPREGIYSDTEIIFSGDSSDTPTDRDNLRYLWFFGDNQTGFGQTILHSYGRPGKYKVKLVTLDDNGLYDISETYVWIDNIYPQLNISEIRYGKTTYDFSEDDIGDFPSDWYRSSLEELLGHNTIVVANVDNFDRAVQIGNGPGVGGIWTSNVSGLPFNQTESGDLNLKNGTIEFWLYTNDTLQSQLYISLFEDNYLDGIYIEFINGTWKHNGQEIVFENLWELENNKWTHFRIDFSSDDSSYLGLADDTFILYADNYASQILTMRHDIHPDITNLTCFGIFTYMQNNETTQVFVDNFGFSWDPLYSVGDNRFTYIQHQFNEGETIILDSISYDTFTDYQQLIYSWGDLYMNIGEWEDQGWRYSYTFTDNDDGDELEGYPILSLVGDPSYMWDIDSYYIEVENVLPTLNIHNAKVVTNVSLAIYNEGTEGANFTIILQSLDSNHTIFKSAYPSSFQDNWLNFNWTLIGMEISKDWNVIVNQTGREGGEHLVQLIFKFENGFETSKSRIFNGTDDIWVIDLDSEWIEPTDELSYVPITFMGSIADPSNDKVALELDYIIEVVHEVNPTTPLTSKNFIITHQPNDILWDYKIIEAGGKRFSINEFNCSIPDDWNSFLASGAFPVSYNFDFNADMTNIDIFGQISNLFINEGISVIGHVLTNHSINGRYNEIQPASIIQNYSLEFNITDKFAFKNLTPTINVQMPVNITEDQTIPYLADIYDFNEDNVSVQFSFGINDGNGLIFHDAAFLGNNRYGINYTYRNAGKYLINIIATDGSDQSKTIHLIEVINNPPYAKIRTYENLLSEDQYITFEADIYDTESDIDSLRYFWDFGDGVVSAERSPSHAYFQAGNYVVKLNVKDDNGATFSALHNITVSEQPPEIYGPFTFNSVEGQTIVLDVGSSDSISDFEMNYIWDTYKALKIYNATYNFMTVDQGQLPGTPFEFTNVNNIQYKVVDEVAGHIKVLEMNDNNELLSGSWIVRYGDSSSVNGSIEFWLRSTHISSDENNFAINFLQYGTGMMPIYVSDNGTWIYRNIFTDNKTIIPNIPRFTSNTWHHVRFDYECTNGYYSELGENQWRIIVDGIGSPNLDLQLGSFPNNNTSYLDSLQIISANNNTMSIYLDAIGYYDGTTQYELGNNVNQVLDRYEFVNSFSGKKPSVAFDEGTYLISLTVENDLSTQVDINLEVEAIAPVLTVTNKKYYGHTGYIDINAYAWDSIIDSTSLEFEWLVNGKRVLMETGTLSSSISVFCNETGVIKGYVSVKDSADLSTSSEFFVNVFMDSNGNGLSNEWELLNNISTIDVDNDGLPNFIEIFTTGTDYDNSDTDDDGLSDGYSNDILVGEFSVGTNPLNNDTDADLLLDGFEWFGWSYTFITNNEPYSVNYSSNPLKSDTDGDGLSDYEEYIYKTNPHESDTDNDMLLDKFEIYEYGSDPNIADTDNDGLIDGLEYEIGTYFNITDTDGDGIDDGAEYYGWGFITNPLTKDTDHDFLSDTSETLYLNYEIDGRKSVEEPVDLIFYQSNVDTAESASLTFLLTYGQNTHESLLSKFRVQIFKQGSQLVLFDEIFNNYDDERYFSKNIDIKDIIEGNGKSYSGTYILKVIYSRSPHGDLSLENFKIAVQRYLDPTDHDFDNDGIMDGVETQLIVEGVNSVEKDDLVNITANTSINNFFEYEIEDIGYVTDADFYLTIISNNTLLGNGSVALKVIQKELSYHVKDKIIYSKNITFSTNDNFVENYSIKPYSFFPYNYQGKYQFIYEIYSTNEQDTFNITNIKFETDGYRDATNSDLRAWITKPDLWDTDDDGWSDYYEINRDEQTNPLKWDTDGDKIKDSLDVEPLYNLILEFRFVTGSIHNLEHWYVEVQPKPILQMLVEFTYNNENTGFISSHTECSEDYREIVYWLFGIEGGIEWRSRLQYPTTANFDDRYFLDIEDDIKRFPMTFSLWDEYLGKIDELGNNLLLSKSYTHNLETSQINVPVEVYTSIGGDLLRAEVITRGVGHANAIAIYKNQTIFNGHYNQYDRMHLFTITVSDTPNSSSPFVQGINTLLIPNAIFMNTKLNSIIHNETVPSFLAQGEFISLDRDKDVESSSYNLESIFVIECNSDEAYELLNLALEGLINETSGETGIINKFASTKLDGFIVEMMNLHHDVLGSIAIINPYLQYTSDQGTVPIPREDRSWVFDYLELIGNAIVGYFAGLYEDAKDFLDEIIENAKGLFEEIIQGIIDLIMFVVMAIIKTTILILAVAVFVLTLITVTLSFLTMIPIALMICAFTGVTLDVTINSFTVNGRSTLKYEYNIGLSYISFLDLYLPSVKTIYVLNNVEFEQELHLLSSLIPLPPPELTDALGSVSLNPLIPEGTDDDFYQGIADIISLIGSGMSIAGGTLLFHSPDKGHFTRIGIIFSKIAIIYTVYTIIDGMYNTGLITKNYVRGILVGGYIAAFFNFLVLLFGGPFKRLKHIKRIVTIYTIYNIVFSAFDEYVLEPVLTPGHPFKPAFFFTTRELFEQPKLVNGFISLGAGFISMLLAPTSVEDLGMTKKEAAYSYLQASLLIPMILYIALCSL